MPFITADYGGRTEKPWFSAGILNLHSYLAFLYLYIMSGLQVVPTQREVARFVKAKAN